MNLNVMDRTEGDIQNVESQMQALRRERVFLVSQLAQARAAIPKREICARSRTNMRA